VLQRIQADPPRKVWKPSDFLDLVSRDAVDKTLQRLTKAERLHRIDRGLHDQPGFNNLRQKPDPPDTRSVIEALGRRDQVHMLVDAMTAANALGLTDAVSAKIVHTDAQRRSLRVGNAVVSFRSTGVAARPRNQPSPDSSAASVQPSRRRSCIPSLDAYGKQPTPPVLHVARYS
jgi:hypothetical protein